MKWNSFQRVHDGCFPPPGLLLINSQVFPKAKAESLLDWIYRLQQEKDDQDLKVLVFTEFVPTQEMIQQCLSDHGFSVVCLNGSMNMGVGTIFGYGMNSINYGINSILC